MGLPLRIESSPSGRLGGARESRTMSLVGQRDSDFIQRCRAGEGDAFRLLVERYQERILRFVTGVVTNPEDARDIAQEAFVQAYRALHRFDTDRNFYTWLYRIAMNLAIDRLRRRKANRETTLEELGDLAGPSRDPSGSVLGEELRGQIKEVLDGLPERYRTVILLRDVEEIPAKEIAEILGCTHATVRWRLHRARKMFRDLWERRNHGADS